jgi:hypothetical protein
MNDPGGPGLSDLGRRAQNAVEPPVRAAGSPLPVGKGGRPQLSPEGEDGRRSRQASPQGRALANTTTASTVQRSSGVDRAMGVLRLALPLLQRVLPLLDGNIGTAVSNILTPHPQPAHPPVNLEPIENCLTAIQAQNRDLHNRIVEQDTSLKRVEDQLEMVREATDRNTREQQELLEDLKTVGNKVNRFAFIALGLLAVSILLNVVLYLHFLHVLP